LSGSEEHSIAKVFEAVAKKLGQRTALVFRDNRLTYNELYNRSLIFANFLKDSGLGHFSQRSELKPWESGQDHLAIDLFNCNQYLEAMLGAYMARVAPFNVNYRYVESELFYLLSETTPKAILFDSSMQQTLKPVLRKVPSLKIPIQLDLNGGAGQSNVFGVRDYETIIGSYKYKDINTLEIPDAPDDLYILCTGGTTGLPKATLWRQADIMAAALGITPGHSLDELADTAATAEPLTAVIAPPLMHGAGQWVALRTLLSGGTVVLATTDVGLNPTEIWQLVESNKAGLLLIVGDAFARPLADELERYSYDLSSLKIIVTGGAITSRGQKERLTKLIPGAIIADIGGASETGSQLTNVSKAGSVSSGVFFPDGFTSIASQDLSRLLNKDETEMGWLVKSGPIPLGYLNDEGKTKATFVEIGGIRMSVPGDRALWRPDGSIELLGRDSVTINTGGEKVFAEEVEQALVSCPGVVDATVVGVPSANWGQAVVAIIETSAENPPDEVILDHLKQNLAKYKLPKKIIRVPKLLRSPSGKADYKWAHDYALKELGDETL
jgi:acyl-CoA synthetase (AMP-forming)/AMP-acid ligase II